MALSDIENFDIFTKVIHEEKQERDSAKKGSDYFYEIDKNTKIDIIKFTNILTEARSFIENRFDKLDSIIISSNDYSKYTDEDQKFIKDIVYFYQSAQKAVTTHLTYDEKCISREAKRAFGSLEGTII